MTMTDIVTLVGTAIPFLLVLMKQTKIASSQLDLMREHSAMLKHLEVLAMENRDTHKDKENLCKLAHDGFRRGIVEDIKS